MSGYVRAGPVGFAGALGLPGRSVCRDARFNIAPLSSTVAQVNIFITDRNL